MISLRDKKKEATRRKILKAAKEIFEEKGFSGSRTIEIAKHANIGEGTLFNYFNSKSELFLTVFFEKFKVTNLTFQGIEVSTEKQVAAEIMKIINYYTESVKKVQKRSLQEYYAVMHDVNLTDSIQLREEFLNRDIIIYNNISRLFIQLQNTNVCQYKFNIDILVKCICSASITTFKDYVYASSMTYEEMMKDIFEQIACIIQGNVLFKH